MAGEYDVDLVEIAATADPPVCRLMDYGKFKYQEQKKAAEAKAKQKVIEVKEVKFRPGTDEGDYTIKMRNLRRFIAEDGDKGKVTLRFRGREITHQDIGMRAAGAHSRRAGRCGGGRAHAQARRPPDDHGAGAEEEVDRIVEHRSAPRSGRRGIEDNKPAAGSSRRRDASRGRLQAATKKEQSCPR